MVAHQSPGVYLTEAPLTSPPEQLGAAVAVLGIHRLTEPGDDKGFALGHGLLTEEDSRMAQKLLPVEWGDAEPHAHTVVWALYERR